MPGDGVQPGTQLGGITQCRQIDGRHEERLLDAVGGVTVAHNAQTEVVEPVGVAVVNPGKSRSISGGGGADQIGVARHIPIDLHGH